MGVPARRGFDHGRHPLHAAPPLSRAAPVVLALVLVACDGDPPVDAGADASLDAGTDAGPDTRVDRDTYDLVDPFGARRSARRVRAQLAVCSADVLSFEPMSREHDEAVAELSRICFGRDSSAAGVRTEREREVAETWVARDGGTVVAFGFLHVVLDEAELHSIGVAPTRRREGIARALLERVCDALRERGAARLFLEVSQRNEAAIELYTNMGFVPQTVREAYYADGSDAIVMQLTL